MADQLQEKMPDGPAKLGYFVSKDQQRKNADNVCVLVVHYNFENTNDESWIREGDAQDVENLENTFRVNRNCNFCSWLSPEKGKLLELLSDHEKLLGKFGCTDVPSVFMLYILSHGDTDGKIFTDHCQSKDPNDFTCFTTTEIFESLKMLTGFEDCLKLINFGPCRGELIDALFYANDENFKNENSCRITYSPMMRNTAVFFSTVETTKAKRDQKGTTFAFFMCQVLDSLEKDESLINVLTYIQNESHKVAIKEKSGQTPEVKVFSQDRSFVFSKISANDSSFSTVEAKSIKIKSKLEFYSWKSSSGENLRRRLAFLISATPNGQFKEIKRALAQNLDFETSERMLRGKPWMSINEASRLDSDIGCIFLIFFGLVSENKETNEVCVEVDGKDTTISEILREFIGPKNDQWIGKPKILFLVNQETSSSDAIGKMQSNMEISATNHSGWLVLVLHNKDGLQKLIEIFKGQELKKEKSLQELLASLLISESKENKDFLNSTLQYPLNFPDWPKSFVELSFSVTNSQKNKENYDCLDSLVKESATKNNICLLSSVAGTGKTTILREMAFQLGKLDPDLQILRISLPRVSFGPLKRKVTEFDFLVNATHISKEEISKQIENKQCVVILDGFDENRRENQEKVLKVIEALEKKQISIWIGTRPHAAEAIKKRISNAVLVNINPLNKNQQIKLLQLETGKSREDCVLFIKNFSSEDILKNPLHLSLVAKYGAEGNLYQIYDQVVRQKVEDSLINKGFDKDNENIFPGLFDEALKRLQQIASCHITEVELNDATRKELEKFNCYGIATFENNKVIFIHQTFAEFLAAQHFLLEIDDVSESESRTSAEDVASVFNVQSSSWCIEFVDLFYSTNEEKIEEDRTSILTVMKLNPDRFFKLIVNGGCINIFKMIYQNICFSNNREGNCISVAKDKTLLVEAIDGAEEIAILLLDTDLINSDEELLTILPYLLKSVAESNAFLFFEKLKTKYPRLPEMIHSKRFVIDAGVVAAEKNHGEILNLLLQSGVDVDFVKRCGPNETFFTKMEFGNALHCAIWFQAFKSVEILLKHGARLAIDINVDSWDPLMVAVQANNLDMVKLILEENISGLQRNKDTFEINEVKSDLNVLHYAIREGRKEIAKFLLHKSPSLKNVENGIDGSPLQISAINGNLEMCRWLVDEAGEDVNTLRPSGEPRDWSLDDNKFMDYFLILQKSDINMTDERGKTALHCAAEHGYLERVQELIHSGANVQAVDENGWNAFHFACKSNSDRKKELIQLLHTTDSLLAKEKTGSGQTGLHISVEFRKFYSVNFESFLIEEIGVDVRAKNNKGCTALRIAVSKGDEKCIDYLMKKDIDLEVENYLGQTCLHFAAERGDLEALQTWIEVGGDFNVVDKEGMTALHIAAESGHLQFVKKFLACAAEEAKNPYIGEGSVGSTLKEYGTVNRCDIKGRTALHLAAESGNVDLVKLLLENNADLTLTDLEGKNAIHFAFEHIGMLQFINEKNRNLVKQRTKDENTILHFLVLSSANREEWDEIAPWIIEQVDDTILNAKNAAGDTPLLLACQTGVWNVAELLLTRNVGINVADWCGKTALHYAAEKGNLKLVMLMHEKGADLTLTNDEGMNALHHATRHFEILLFIHEKNNDLLKQRLENGDTSLHVATGPLPSNSDAILWLVEQCENDLNETNSNGETPFLLACKRMKWNFAKILLDKNVDINVKDKNGRTALHYAVSLFRRDIIEDSYAYDLVQELCKRGADLALTDNDGKNAFHHAIENFNMALFIHELNGDLVKQLLNNGDTSLHLAIKLNKDNRNDKLIIWLVEQGVVDLNAKNASGETPLLLACERRWLKVAELLLTRNVEVNVSNRRGKTAMHYAAKNGNLSLVKLLHEKGADLTLSDNDGKNAFHHAITNYDMALFIHELNGDLVKQRLKNRDTSLHLAIKLYKRNKNDDVLNWLAEQDVIDLNVKNDLNETPLILACKKKLWPCTFFKILMSKNVDVNIRDVKGKSARDYIDDSCPTHLLRRFDELEEASPS